MSDPSGSTATRRNPDDQAEHPANVTNIKETIESILVAFILAFIFRSFVMEAFVIPTGSMAPTLLGAHMRFTCPDCGYEFTVNYPVPSGSRSSDLKVSSDGLSPSDVYCPNCGFLIAPRGRNVNDILPVHYGDRILVLKYIYLLHPPRRWDVVVFKSPNEPEDTHYQENYIKRLVGLPGEELMVLDGDVYVRTKADPQWRIQTKPRNIQEALWRLVYDNDFYPQHLKREGQGQWVQPWTAVAGTGWNLATTTGDGRTFHFDNPDGSGTLRFDPKANMTTQSLTDYLVYDAANQPRRNEADDERANPVSDLKLAAYYHRTSGDGAFRMSLSKFANADHTFTAEFTPDTVRLLHRIDETETEVARAKLSDLGLRTDQPFYVELMNVDYRVTLRINGKEVFAPLDYPPDIKWLLSRWNPRPRNGKPGEAAIAAQNQTCTLDHIGLWRDVYYTNHDLESETPLHAATPDNPTVLGPDEFFVMGDNSAISGDARYWPDPVNLPREGLRVPSGRVPGQFLLGQAVFVYWPAGYRAFDTHLAIIPDFGDMRWIH